MFSFCPEEVTVLNLPRSITNLKEQISATKRACKVKKLLKMNLIKIIQEVFDEELDGEEI